MSKRYLTRTEYNAILGGLRYLDWAKLKAEYIPESVMSILTDGSEEITAEGIDDLCMAINNDEVQFTVEQPLCVEVIAAHFDGRNSDTDDRILWVIARDRDEVEEAIKGTGARTASIIELDFDHGVDFRLPRDLGELRQCLKDFERNPPKAEPEFECLVWFERDRANVALMRNGEEVFSLWDDDVTQAIEDGFLVPPPGLRTNSNSAWLQPAIDYARDQGLL